MTIETVSRRRHDHRRHRVIQSRKRHSSSRRRTSIDIAFCCEERERYWHILSSPRSPANCGGQKNYQSVPEYKLTGPYPTMFFSDLAALQKVTAKQHNPLETRYGDHAGDPEIERMLNGSPLIQGWEPTLQTEELYAGDDQVRQIETFTNSQQF